MKILVSIKITYDFRREAEFHNFTKGNRRRVYVYVCAYVCGHKRPRKEHPRARNSISFEKWKMFRFYPILPTSRLAIRVLPDDISRRVFTRILKLFNKNGRGAAPSLIINTRINNKSEENNLYPISFPRSFSLSPDLFSLSNIHDTPKFC